MSWNAILNQHRAKDILRSILEKGRIAHAYLFSGPPGAGMDAMAMEFAKAVNCEKVSGEACDDCPSCERVNRHQHPDIHLVFPLPVGKNEDKGDSPTAKLSEDDISAIREQIGMKWNNPYHKIFIPKATTIKINSIREIRKEVSFKPSEGAKKVFLVLDAEMMSAESSNALLKTLEEPPPGTVLILTTTQPDQLLPTLVSRCQQIRFQSLTSEDIRRGLTEREKIPDREAETIARMSRGDYTKALQLLESDYMKRHDVVLDFLRTCVKKSRADLPAIIERMTGDAGRDDIVDLLRFLQAWLRDAMVVRHDPARGTAVGDETLQKFTSAFPAADYQRADRDIERAISLIEKNVYIPMILLTLALSLAKSITGQPAVNFQS